MGRRGPRAKPCCEQLLEDGEKRGETKHKKLRKRFYQGNGENQKRVASKKPSEERLPFPALLQAPDKDSDLVLKSGQGQRQDKNNGNKSLLGQGQEELIR